MPPPSRGVVSGRRAGHGVAARCRKSGQPPDRGKGAFGRLGPKSDPRACAYGLCNRNPAHDLLLRASKLNFTSPNNAALLR